MALDLTGVDLTTEVVRTPRLVLRPYREEDVEPVFRACQDPAVQRWIGVLPSPYTRADAVEYVTGLAVRERADGSTLATAVEADGELVGSAGLHALTTGRLGPEIGYWSKDPRAPQPSQARAGALHGGRPPAHGAPRVHLFTDVGNAASQAVARRAGFAEEGVVRSCLQYRDGSRADAMLFGRPAEG